MGTNKQLLPVSASMNSQLNGDAFNVRFWSMLNLMTIGFVRESRLISGWLRFYLPPRLLEDVPTQSSRVPTV